MRDDGMAKPVKAGQPFTPTYDGWFVPNSLMREMATELEQKERK